MWDLDYKESKFWRIDSLNCGVEKTLESPLDCRRSNQSILKEISPEYSLEGLMLKLKFQYWPPDGKNWLLGKDPEAGKDWRQEENGSTEDEMAGWHHWLNGHSLTKLWELVKAREAWCAAVHGVVKSQTWLNDWTELNNSFVIKNLLLHSLFFSCLPLLPDLSPDSFKTQNLFLKI